MNLKKRTKEIVFGQSYSLKDWEEDLLGMQLKVDLCPEETRKEFADQIIDLVSNQNLSHENRHKLYLALIQAYLDKDSLKKSFKKNPRAFLNITGKMMGKIAKEKANEIIRGNK